MALENVLLQQFALPGGEEVEPTASRRILLCSTFLFRRTLASTCRLFGNVVTVWRSLLQCALLVEACPKAGVDHSPPRMLQRMKNACTRRVTWCVLIRLRLLVPTLILTSLHGAVVIPTQGYVNVGGEICHESKWQNGQRKEASW